MIISEIIEGAVGIWSKGKGGLVRRYRCTAGSRKGRIVSSPTTCNQPKRVSSSINIRKAKYKYGRNMNIKSQRTKRAGAFSKRLAKINKRNSLTINRYKPKKRKARRR
tara:strand:+ start:3526 stop:3849 length:324 start_codon:yes stop_codon:yes gene_type:complete